jgi:hypothetical protein
MHGSYSPGIRPGQKLRIWSPKMSSIKTNSVEKPIYQLSTA